MPPAIRVTVTAGLDHRHNRSLRITSASSEELAVALRQTKRIAGPTAADRNGVYMRVECETRACAIIDLRNDIRSTVCHGTNLRGEAESVELGREERGGLSLPPWRILCVDGDEPLKEASKPSDIGCRREIGKGHCTFPLAATS
jgi:hypothetical protein